MAHAFLGMDASMMQRHLSPSVNAPGEIPEDLGERIDEVERFDPQPVGAVRAVRLDASALQPDNIVLRSLSEQHVIEQLVVTDELGAAAAISSREEAGFSVHGRAGPGRGRGSHAGATRSTEARSSSTKAGEVHKPHVQAAGLGLGVSGSSAAGESMQEAGQTSTEDLGPAAHGSGASTGGLLLRPSSSSSQDSAGMDRTSANVEMLLNTLQPGCLRDVRFRFLTPFPTPFHSGGPSLSSGGHLQWLDNLPSILAHRRLWEGLHTVTLDLPGFDAALGAAVSVLLAHPQSHVRCLRVMLHPNRPHHTPAFPPPPAAANGSAVTGAQTTGQPSWAGGAAGTGGAGVTGREGSYGLSAAEQGLSNSNSIAGWQGQPQAQVDDEMQGIRVETGPGMVRDTSTAIGTGAWGASAPYTSTYRTQGRAAGGPVRTGHGSIMSGRTMPATSGGPGPSTSGLAGECPAVPVPPATGSCTPSCLDEESDPVLASITALIEGLRSARSLERLQLDGFPDSAAGAAPGVATASSGAAEGLTRHALAQPTPATTNSQCTLSDRVACAVREALKTNARLQRPGRHSSSAPQQALQLVVNGNDISGRLRW